jgi:nucleoside-diphosphate-sugar epimerase
MRVVVVGATGNVGTSVVERLAAEPAVNRIIGVARRRPEWQPPKTDWAVADVATDDLAPLFRGADAVVHLAWLFQPTHDPVVTWRTNAIGSIRVFQAAAEAGVGALVYSSSVGAYSPGPKDRPVDETWPTHSLPTAAYGREKAYVERALDTFVLEHPDIRVVRLRPGFMFKRQSASQQRRLFAGPFLPGRLVRRGLVPVIPDLPGLVFQALHTDDAAEAFRLAVVGDASGPFNLAAAPVIDAAALATMLGARRVPIPKPPARAAMAAAWHLRVVPVDPALLDLVLAVPVMDSARAERVLGWKPQVSALDAIGEFLAGLRSGAGMATPPLDAHPPGGRIRELATGVGGQAV